MFTVESVESPELHDSSEFEEAVANHDHELTEEVYTTIVFIVTIFA